MSATSTGASTSCCTTHDPTLIFRPAMVTSLRIAGLVAVLAAFFHPAAHAVQDCELNGQSVNPANGNTTAGKTGLMRCKDRDSGELMREQQLQNGVFMGLVRFYDKGKLVKEHSVNARGNLEGRAREFSPTGQLLREATYENGHETGLVRSFHPGGQLRRVAFYAEPGERASVEFTERGQLSALRCGDKPMLAPAVDDARLCGFVNGPVAGRAVRRQGHAALARWPTWPASACAAKSSTTTASLASQDEINGNQRTERRWSSEGVKRREVVFLLVERGAIRQREQEFSEKGTLVRDQRWNAAGEPLQRRELLPQRPAAQQGELRRRPAMRAVEITEFHDNGQRAADRALPGGRPRRAASRSARTSASATRAR